MMEKAALCLQTWFAGRSDGRGINLSSGLLALFTGRSGGRGISSSSGLFTFFAGSSGGRGISLSSGLDIKDCSVSWLGKSARETKVYLQIGGTVSGILSSSCILRPLCPFCSQIISTSFPSSTSG